MTDGRRHEDDLAFALLLADTADAVTTRRYRSLDLAVETKPDLTPVSDADRTVERTLRDLLGAQRRGDAVVGEEFGAQAGAPPARAAGVGAAGVGAAGAGPARRWILDPVDGTKNFVRGVPVWASLIALEEDGRPVVGVVSAPALGRRWWAGRGLGAWTSGPEGPARRCQVSRVSRLADAFVSYSSLAGWPGGGHTGGFARLVDRVWRTRAFGDFWSHVLVAEGAVDASFEPEVALWDVAALQVVVEEAGGRCTDLGGAPDAGGGSVVCSNGLLHDEVLAALRG